MSPPIPEDPEARDAADALVAAMWTDMRRDAPDDVPPAHLLGDLRAAARCQAEAFSVGDDDWWRFGADFRCLERDAAGEWVCEVGPAEEGAPGGAD